MIPSSWIMFSDYGKDSTLDKTKKIIRFSNVFFLTNLNKELPPS